MRVSLLLFSLYLMLSGISFAQDSLRQSLGFRVGLARTDFFAGVEYSNRQNLIHPCVSFDAGINRTFFQQRFFPKVAIGASMDLLKRSRSFYLGPNVQFAYSRLKVNKNSDHAHSWFEFFGGTRFEYGKSWRFVNLIQMGPMIERYYDQTVADQRSIVVFAYSFQLGFSYAW